MDPEDEAPLRLQPECVLTTPTTLYTGLSSIGGLVPPQIGKLVDRDLRPAIISLLVVFVAAVIRSVDHAKGGE
jgi:hypothetical protein